MLQYIYDLETATKSLDSLGTEPEDFRRLPLSAAIILPAKRHQGNRLKKAQTVVKIAAGQPGVVIES